MFFVQKSTRVDIILNKKIFVMKQKKQFLDLFWECNIVKSLWLEMAEIFKKKKTSVM
jgi:hypothetical protein